MARVTALRDPYLIQPTGRATCAGEDNGRRCQKRALVRSAYCLDCELAGAGVIVVETRDPGPLRVQYRVYCLLCPYAHYVQLTRDAAAHTRLPACPRCRSTLLLEEDAGSIGSPWISDPWIDAA